MSSPTSPPYTIDSLPPPYYKCPSPSPSGILEVKALLLKKIPLEIVDVVIEFAEYWACTSVTTGGGIITAGAYRTRSDELILRTFPLGYLPTTSQNIIPHENYLTKPNTAHAIESLGASQSMTSNVLSLWKAQSSTQLKGPCRKVVFTIKSRDQGWGSDRRPDQGVYEHSWSWFDVGLERLEAIDMAALTLKAPMPAGFIVQFRLESEKGGVKSPSSIACDFLPVLPAVIQDLGSASTYRYNHPFQPSDTRLQSNRTANPETKEHVITWACDDSIDPSSPEGALLEREGRGNSTGNGDFVRNLKFGDIITVWARCRFGGWINRVEEVKIDVYWAV